MQNIKARIGTQNVRRVLSNVSGAPTKLIQLNDVDISLRTEDGMILVWDLPSQKFIMTSVIDSSTTTIKGIVYFDNQQNSFLPANGALIVSGGVGIGKNLNVGGDIKISGIATFVSNLDIDSSVDILNNLVVNNNFQSVGVTTLSFSGGITTTGGDLYVGGDLYIKDDLTFDEFTARNINVTGLSSLSILNVSGTSSFIQTSTFNNDVFVIGTLNAGLIDGGEY